MCFFYRKTGFLHDLTSPHPPECCHHSKRRNGIPPLPGFGWHGARVGFTKPPGFTWCCKPHRNLWDSKWLHPKIPYWDVMIWRKGQQQKPTTNNHNNNNNKPKLWGVLKEKLSVHELFDEHAKGGFMSLYSTFLVGYPPFGTGKQFSLCSSCQTAAYSNIHIRYMDPTGNDLNTPSFPEKSLDKKNIYLSWFSLQIFKLISRQLLPWLVDPYG